jgi:hypothetical protein
MKVTKAQLKEIIKEEVAGVLKTEVSREVRGQREAELSARDARATRRGEHEDSIQNRIDISKTRTSDLDGAEQGYDGTPAAADARRERRDLLDKIERLEAELQNLKGIRK